jgi:hypothetical protein
MSAGVDLIFRSIVAEHGGEQNLSAAHLGIARKLAAVLAGVEDGSPADAVRAAEAVAKLTALLPAKPTSALDLSRLDENDLATIDAILAKGAGGLEALEAARFVGSPLVPAEPRADDRVAALERELEETRHTVDLQLGRISALAAELEAAKAKPVLEVEGGRGPAASEGSKAKRASLLNEPGSRAGNVVPLEAPRGAPRSASESEALTLAAQARDLAPVPGAPRNIHNSLHSPVSGQSLSESLRYSDGGGRWPWSGHHPW